MAEKLLEEVYQTLPEPREAKEFSTEVFLYSLREPSKIHSTEAAKIIEKLCKKAEVPKRLVVEYSYDLSRTINVTPVAPGYAVYFTVLLLTLALENKDLKYLNCALKLIDGGLYMPKFSLPQMVHEYAGVVVNKLLVTVRRYERS